MAWLETPKGRATSWVVQGLLALLFLIAGGTKLLTPTSQLAAESHLSGELMKLVGFCEVAGALGLVLPGMLEIAEVLTPIAAAGLVVLMMGATAATVAQSGLLAALFPVAVGLLAGFVVYARWPRDEWDHSHDHRLMH